jgi:plasmid stabilization system protein ParE
MVRKCHKRPEFYCEYIALDSEYSAQKFVQELINKANLLIFHPEKGRPIPENIPGNYR